MEEGKITEYAKTVTSFPAFPFIAHAPVVEENFFSVAHATDGWLTVLNVESASWLYLVFSCHNNFTLVCILVIPTTSTLAELLLTNDPII